MKNRFVKITLILTMLLVMAVPAQAFAAEKTCTTNQTKTLNTQITKIYGQLPQSTMDQLMGKLSQISCGKIDAAQLKDLMKQCTGGKVTTTTPAKATTPSKTTTTPAKATTPSKTTTTPAKATTPSKTTTTTPSKTTTNTGTVTNTNTSSAIGSYEQQVVDLVNKERAAAGLPALKVNTELSAMAEKKAEDMRDKNYFDHTSPTYGSPFDMMKKFGIGYTAAGENIAMGQKTPADVMTGWMNSSGHRANILNSNYTEIGVGYVTNSNGNTYWVQEFIRP